MKKRTVGDFASVFQEAALPMEGWLSVADGPLFARGSKTGSSWPRGSENLVGPKLPHLRQAFAEDPGSNAALCVTPLWFCVPWS